MYGLEKSIKKYLFWRWEYLRRNKQYISDYGDLLKNGKTDYLLLTNVASQGDNSSSNNINKEKLLKFINTYHIYPCNPTIKTTSLDMLLNYINNYLYEKSVPLILCGLLSEIMRSDNELEMLGCRLIENTFNTITLEFDTNTDLNTLTQALSAHYERRRAFIHFVEYFHEACQKGVEGMTCEEYRFVADFLRSNVMTIQIFVIIFS